MAAYMYDQQKGQVPWSLKKYIIAGMAAPLFLQKPEDAWKAGKNIVRITK